MEYALNDIFNVASLLHNVIEYGPYVIEKRPISSGDIAYVSSLCILAFLGTFGNILILIMFSKKELSRTSYSIYIRAAAISDTIFMLMNISEDVMDHVTSYPSDKFTGTSLEFCIFWSVTKGTFRTSSPWIVVALALDRCVAIWNPLNKSRYCTKKTAAIVTAGIFLATLGVELGLALPFSVMLIGEGLYPVCEITTITDKWSIIKRLVSETGLPCITMLIPNLLVIFKIQQSLSFRRTFSSTNGQQEKVAKSARPLLVVSCLAFITLLPISITEVVELTKMEAAETADYQNPENDYPDYRNHYGDYLNPGNDYEDHKMFANRNESSNRFNFSNETLENITMMRSFEEKDVSNGQIERTTWGTGNERNASQDLIESTKMGTDEERYVNSDLIESTKMGTDEERDVNSDLVESTRNEDVDGQHDEMDTEDLENQQDNHKSETDHLENENGRRDEEDLENQQDNYKSETDNLENENGRRDEEEQDNLDDEHSQIIIDSIWRTCNFIYMCNFAQNFYLLILSSSTYRNAIIKMFRCKCQKKKRENPHVIADRVIQQPAVQTISNSSTPGTASTSLEAINVSVQ